MKQFIKFVFLFFVVTQLSAQLNTPIPTQPSCGGQSVAISVIHFTWSSVPNATSYVIEISDTDTGWNSNFAFPQSTTLKRFAIHGGDTFYNWYDAESSKTYYYSVQAQNSTTNQDSNFSNPCSFSTTVTPCSLPVPSGVSATVISPYRINVSWNNISGADHYDIFDNGSFLLSTSSNSYLHQNLQENSTHCYRISACCASASNCTNQSSQICETTSSNTTYRISGETRKSNGDFIAGALVTFTGINGSSNLPSYTSLSDGHYHVDNVPNGWYGIVNATKTGYTFQSETISNVTNNVSRNIIGTENPPNNPTVTLTYPNNQTFDVGDTMNITWSSTEQHHYGLYLYKGDETNQIATINLESVSTSTSYNWLIPTEIEGHALAGTDYKIKIAVWNSAGVSIGDYSNFITINSASTNCTYTDTNGLTTEELDAITFLCNENLLDNDGTVEPNDQIQRSALAKLGYKSINLQANPVADVYPSPSMDLQNESVWYYSYAKNLIYLEYGDGIAPFDNNNFFFYPAKPITKAHALKVLLETWNIPIQSGTSYTYTDISINSSAYDYKYIQTAYQLGIISDTADNLFHPNEEVLRKDVFVWLYRIMNNTSISLPTPTESDFFLTGNYTPYNFSNYSAMHSGNFNFYTESSFNISGIGIPLDFAFTYNSYATEITSDLYPIKPLGFGWTHTYNSYIVEKVKEYTGSPNDRNAIIHFPTGEFNVYNHLESNQYEPVTIGVYDELEKISGSTYRLTTKNKMVYVYEKFTGTPSTFPYVLTSITDRNNNTLTIQYGLAEASSGYYRINKVIGTSGRELNFTYYSGSDLIKTVSDPISRSVTFNYDGYDFSYVDQPNLTSYVNPKGNLTTYNYGTTEQEKHLLKTITLPKNNTITNTYQNKKLLSSQTNGNQPTNYNIQPNYGQTGNDNFIQTIITNPNNNETVTLQYNRDGNVHYIDEDNTTISTITYHATQTNLPISITTNGRTTTMSYDNYGNVLSVNKPLGVSYHYTYTNYNDVETYTDPKSNTYNYNYSNGNIYNIVTPRGTTNFGVNSRGLITSITNPFGIQTTFSHDSYGNVNSTNTGNISTSSNYDNASRLRYFINPNGDRTDYLTDANDNVYRETFNSRTTNYHFDLNDNLDRITNARNRPTALNYNNEDLLTSVVFEGATDAYTYLIDGKINTYTNPKADVFTYNYDNNNGRLQSVTSGSDFVNYTYKPNTNNIKTVTNNNGAINYTFDVLNRIKSTTDYYGNTVQYNYDQNSNVTKITYPDGKEVDYTYYSDNLLHTVKDWNNNETTYTYRSDGLLLTTIYPNGTYETITYDAIGRPNSLSWKKADGTVINEYTFTSDNNGNHTTENKTEQLTPTVLPNVSTSYTHNNLNRLLTAGNDSFSYDANGNTTAGSGNTYTWDKYDRLETVTGNFNAQYEYDGNGDRRKSVKNGVTTKFVLDVLGLSKVLVETDNSNDGQKYYVYGLGLISRTDNSNNTRYYHYDYRGSTIAMTNETETITHKYEYSDFGEVLQADEEDYNQFRYVGKYGIQYETENLAFMRARYYNPVVGRFLTEDPIWSTNLYTYSGNNPVNNIDPSGEVFVTGTIIILGGIYGFTKTLSAITSNQLSLDYQYIDPEKSAYYDKKGQSDFLEGQLEALSAATGGIGKLTKGKEVFNSRLFGGKSSLFGRKRLGSFEGKANGVLNRSKARLGWSWDKKTKTHYFQPRYGQKYKAKHYKPWYKYKP